jgi:hypothetical protein
MTPAEEKYLADYKQLAYRESVAKDAALAEAATLREKLAEKPVERKAAPPAPEKPPAPPPAPAASPPPRPASMSAFNAMPLHEQKHVAEAYGGRDALLEALGEAFLARNSIGGASRGGFSGGLTTIPEALGGPHQLTEKERAAHDTNTYNIGAPRASGGNPDPASSKSSRAAGPDGAPHHGFFLPEPAPPVGPRTKTELTSGFTVRK